MSSKPREATESNGGDAGAVLFLEPTPEMRCFARVFDRLLALGDPRAGTAARLVAGGMVAPLAHFANLSLDFQAYLFLVFHRRRLAWITHALLQPLTLVVLAAGLATIRLHGPAPFQWNAAWLAGVVLGVWYAVQGIANRMALLGGVMFVVALGSAAAGTLVASVVCRAGGGATLLLASCACTIALSLVVALSHLREPLLPPRLNGLAHWAPLSAMFLRPGGGLLPAGALARSAVRLLALGVVWGTINELWGFWRLTPVSVLRGLWALGYQPARRARVVGAADEAMALGNPALDFVGVGGAAPLARAVPRR